MKNYLSEIVFHHEIPFKCRIEKVWNSVFLMQLPAGGTELIRDTWRVPRTGILFPGIDRGEEALASLSLASRPKFVHL